MLIHVNEPQYRTTNNIEENNLVLKVDDSSVGYLSAAAHYDDDYSVSLIVAGTFRNILGKGSKVFTDLVIGPNPRFRGMYVKDNGGRPGYGAKNARNTPGFNRNRPR